MTGSASFGVAPPLRGRASRFLYRRIPIWPILVFAGVIAAAYSPNVLQVFSLLDGYDMLSLKSSRFFFHNESEHLFSVARPLAGLFSNVPLLPVQSAADFRWVRILSILTVCVTGAQMIANCIVRLNTSKLDAVAVTIVTFLVPPFIYAILSASAWAPHLVTSFIVVGAYTLLGRSNAQAMPFLVLARRRDYRAFWHQVFVYSCSRPVWSACLIYQLAFYDYPPYATIMVVFPAIGILFSRAPMPHRLLIAVRDLCFIGAGFFFFFLSTALIYLPFVRLFTLKGSGDLSVYENEILAVGYANHQFKYNLDFGTVVTRLGDVINLSGDLWFLPQLNMHVLVGAVFLFALFLASGMGLFARRDGPPSAVDDSLGLGRLRLVSGPPEGVVTLFVLACCFVMAAVPVLASAGGFITYRTIVSPIAVASISFVFAVRGIASTIWQVAGNPFSAAAIVGTAATVLTVGAAFTACFDANYAIMKLGRNEFAYFTEIARRAIDHKSKTIVLIDPRPTTVDFYDEQGRPVPSFELGCFSSYCAQNSSIVRVAGAQFGLPLGSFQFLLQRGDSPVPGLTCEMLTAPTAFYPPNASERSIGIISEYRTLTPLTCATVSVAWHDLGIDMRQGVKGMKISHASPVSPVANDNR